MKKRNKGITLIALIITIIVMLILVAISVQIVINSSLFDSAKTAARKTADAFEKEGAEGGKVNIAGEVYNSMEEYMEKSCTHEWEKWQVTKEPTCTEEGSKRRSCPRCEKVEVESIDKLGHDWDPSTGDCKECGTECTHEWGEWQTITEPTCTIAGSEKRTCSTCGENEIKPITALGHNYENNVCTRCGGAKPATVLRGDYIKYEVAYTDIEKGYKYTEKNGWRLLHAAKNDDGTYRKVELISTGLPARFYNRYDKKGTWWVTDSVKLNEFKKLLRW